MYMICNVYDMYNYMIYVYVICNIYIYTCNMICNMWGLYVYV